MKKFISIILLVLSFLQVAVGFGFIYFALAGELVYDERQFFSGLGLMLMSSLVLTLKFMDYLNNKYNLIDF